MNCSSIFIFGTVHNEFLPDRLNGIVEDSLAFGSHPFVEKVLLPFQMFYFFKEVRQMLIYPPNLIRHHHLFISNIKATYGMNYAHVLFKRKSNVGLFK